jgi:hypothetical protein
VAWLQLTRPEIESQLGAALEIRKRWLGWSVPQLIDRLRPVGVGVEVEKVLLPI